MSGDEDENALITSISKVMLKIINFISLISRNKEWIYNLCVRLLPIVTNYCYKRVMYFLTTLNTYIHNNNSIRNEKIKGT